MPSTPQRPKSVARSRAISGEPIESVVGALGGELAPFQWAGVRYALDARRVFIADEQGLGKTVEALASLEADDAYPAIVVCPASMKLIWEREASKWLPHRSVAVISGRVPVPPAGEITILNYEIVAAHREALARRRPRAIVVDESHYCKNPRAKRTQAVRSLAASVTSDGLRLALTGTPVLNHADELIAQLRVIDRLSDFGSGARFSNRFRGMQSEERLHWHLRRVCFVRRLKSEVLPQLPAKRQVVVPVALTNTDEYKLAERDVIEWLRTQPLDLSELNAKIAITLRAERLAQLGLLQRLAARGKLAAALAWIDDFLASGEPLVVFARHVEVQQAVVDRFGSGGAVHLLGSDSTDARQAAIDAFQSDGRAAADRLRHPRRRPGDHAHPRVQRLLPGARMDAGDARPGRGPLPPDRPARRRHRLVPARRRHDRRDDEPPDPAQARHDRGGDRRPHGSTATASSTRSSASCATASRSRTCARSAESFAVSPAVSCGFRCRPHRFASPTSTPRASTSRGSTTRASRSSATSSPSTTPTPPCAARTSAATRGTRRGRAARRAWRSLAASSTDCARPAAPARDARGSASAAPPRAPGSRAAAPR